MNKCAVLEYRGHRGLNQVPLDLQSYAPQLSYIVMCLLPNSTK